jgi:hypothetical protein
MSETGYLTHRLSSEKRLVPIRPVCAGRNVAVSSQGGALFQYFGVAARHFASSKKPLISGAKRPARSIID